MYVREDGERFYLNPWEFNVCRIMTELDNTIVKNGGRVKRNNRPCVTCDGTGFIEVKHTTYINFVLNGYHYYYQIDENPFFDFYYTKAPIIGNKYSKEHCLENDTKDWIKDEAFYTPFTDEKIKNLAQFIFEMLTTAKATEKIIRTVRINVKNTYDDKYHKEYKPEKERFETIDY